MQFPCVAHISKQGKHSIDSLAEESKNQWFYKWEMAIPHTDSMQVLNNYLPYVSITEKPNQKTNGAPVAGAIILPLKSLQQSIAYMLKFFIFIVDKILQSPPICPSEASFMKLQFLHHASDVLVHKTTYGSWFCPALPYQGFFSPTQHALGAKIFQLKVQLKGHTPMKCFTSPYPLTPAPQLH